MSEMIFESIRAPVWGSADHTVINLLVKISRLPDEIMFSACQYDPEPYGQEAFNRAVGGEFGPIADFVPPLESAVQIMPRNARNMIQIQAEIAPLAAAEALAEMTLEEVDHLASLRRELVDLYRAGQDASQ